ncbi:cupredoxin domain-containing protein [Maribacter cobaltidurans]|uniref:Uncharacterized protein n=1 Tax=Maribacter cobaltidurans TaxID=1178778 RepID=A0A223V4J1_9FLAO|nr:hypothetical protein [Maribacter cobaltidurans]ASV30216.1 hypothetical protein CJ263_08285 [Maribacter cobaltidurans]GGD76723.1 hypothetical protein GCM10011412_13110 [Maribacter cobaltidurans]
MKNQIKIQNSKLVLMAFALVLISLQACKEEKKKPVEETPEKKEIISVIDIVTENMEFQAPDTIPSGWVTWKYHNESPQPHFILIDDPIDSITVEDFENELLPPFGEGITLLYEGKNEEAFAAFGKIPEWYGGTVWPGGVGLISGGHTAQTTMNLAPGYYIMECYVKMPNGMFHTNMGMYKVLVVSDEVSPLSKPNADISVSVSGETGISFESPTGAGAFTFSVHYLDQKKHEHFQGHDVNLVKIANGADIKKLETWMNWLNLDGLIDPVPEGFTFLGGVNDMPAGKTGYFTATLEPGNYALISEVPEASSKNMLKVFEVK